MFNDVLTLGHTEEVIPIPWRHGADQTQTANTQPPWHSQQRRVKQTYCYSSEDCSEAGISSCDQYYNYNDISLFWHRSSFFFLQLFWFWSTLQDLVLWWLEISYMLEQWLQCSIGAASTLWSCLVGSGLLSWCSISHRQTCNNRNTDISSPFKLHRPPSVKWKNIFGLCS